MTVYAFFLVMTILFEKDWVDYPSAIVDYKTTNTSFLRVTSVFQQMGVKNCLFPLSLMQPALQGVDPFSDELTAEQKVMIKLETEFNYWYYVREIVRFQPDSGPNPIRYRANRANIALSWCFLNHIDFFVVMPRQTGKSGSIDSLLDWIINLAASNTLVNLLTLSDSRRAENIESLKSVRDLYPDYLYRLQADDSDNQKGITYKSRGNRLTSAVSQSSVSGANKVGRGLSSPVLYADEMAFITNNSVMIPAALAAGGEARDQAALSNQPYGNLYATTAGKKDSPEGSYAYDLIQSGTVWSERFYDTQTPEELRDVVVKNSMGDNTLNPIINGTFNHRQIGKSDAWLRRKIAESRGTAEKAARDYLNVWTSGTESSPLTSEQNDRIRESMIEPVYNEIGKNNYIIRWYLEGDRLHEMMQNGEVILGLDASEAVGRDAIALVFISSIDLSTVAAATINETNLIVFSRFLTDLMVRYPKIILVPERQYARAMIDALLIELPRNGIDPFKRIFNQVVNGKDEKPKDFAEVFSTGMSARNSGFYDRWKRYFGFNTSASSRNELYHEIFQNAVKEAGHLVYDQTLSTEIRGLTVKNGRVDHGPNSHDDHVIAWLLAHWFLTRGKNLSYYGVNTSQLLSRVHYEGRQLTDEEEWEMEKQRRIKAEIEQIYEELKKDSNEYTIAQKESRLHVLSERVVESNEPNAMSIDALIQQASDERDKRHRKTARHQQQQMIQRRGLSMRRGWR